MYALIDGFSTRSKGDLKELPASLGNFENSKSRLGHMIAVCTARQGKFSPKGADLDAWFLGQPASVTYLTGAR